MAKNKGGQYTANIYVPDQETDVREWLSRQDSASKSMRALIHWAIGRWGQEDVFVAEFAQRTVAVPSTLSQPAVDVPKVEPERVDVIDKPAADLDKPAERVPDPSPEPEKPAVEEDIARNWRNSMI